MVPFKSNSTKVYAAFLIVVLAFLFHHKHINEFPSHIHAWAQADRYALSLGFLDNGMNFFKPQTYTYNHQFPNNWEIPTNHGTTAVDFPIHDYIPALAMKLTGNTSPWVFRLYILIYSIIGLYFLFKLAIAFTGSHLKSYMVLVFAATSPVFVYYQSGFLPTIPSLSNAIIGIYFYYLHITSNSRRSFAYSILFLALATLSRTTFAIPFIALLCLEAIRLAKRDTTFQAKLIYVIPAILVIIGYQLYNTYLRNEYGSIFLSKFLPPTSFEHTKEIAVKAFNSWIFHYFTVYHYVLVGLLLIYFLIMLVRRKTESHTGRIYFAVFTLGYFAGCILFSLLMFRQFVAHDYYFLDTFYLPVILAFIFLLSFINLPTSKRDWTILVAIVIAISTLQIFQSLKYQQKRKATGPWDRTAATISNFEGAAALLDSLGVSKNSKILVIEPTAPNIPFILMQRGGYVVMKTTRENIESALAWDYDYMVFPNENFVPTVFSVYPEILSQVERVANNGKITICRLSKDSVQQDLIDFFGYKSLKPVFEACVNFDDIFDTSWTNILPTTKQVYSGANAGYLPADSEYGITYKSTTIPALNTHSRPLVFSSQFFRTTSTDLELVVSISTKGQSVFYKTYNLKTLLKKTGVWQELSLIIQLPKVESDNYEFALYLWNTGKGEIYFDNFQFKIF
jgi:hypothetical protein